MNNLALTINSLECSDERVSDNANYYFFFGSDRLRLSRTGFPLIILNSRFTIIPLPEDKIFAYIWSIVIFFASLSDSQVDCLVNIPWCYYCHFFFFKHYLSTVFGQVLCSRVAFPGNFSHSMTGVFMTWIIYLVCLSLIKHHTVVLNYNSDERKLILSSLDKREFYVFFLFPGKQYLFCICQTILARYFYLPVGR